MPKTSKTKAPPADEIAERATRGEDVSRYFTNNFTVVKPVRRVNVDLTPGMLRALDSRAAHLNISRQAVIKTLLAQALHEATAATTIPAATPAEPEGTLKRAPRVRTRTSPPAG